MGTSWLKAVKKVYGEDESISTCRGPVQPNLI